MYAVLSTLGQTIECPRARLVCVYVCKLVLSIYCGNSSRQSFKRVSLDCVPIKAGLTVTVT